MFKLKSIITMLLVVFMCVGFVNPIKAQQNNGQVVVTPDQVAQYA